MGEHSHDGSMFQINNISHLKPAIIRSFGIEGDIIPRILIS